ncbi:MAG: hypothetical protein N7Q72_01940 [Spiroplasma sp. Tabriz.8]|nr:hypothetical protein [Spiroplasma sp. Tabriz.8]
MFTCVYIVNKILNIYIYIYIYILNMCSFLYYSNFFLCILHFY